MKKSNKDQNKASENAYEFDLTGVQDESAKIDEIEELEKKVFQYEKILLDNELGHLIGKDMSDEEYICVKAINSIKKLVVNEIQTKDDINMFDVLYRNLCTLRGIKPTKDKKEKPKSREELISIIKGGVK